MQSRQLLFELTGGEYGQYQKVMSVFIAICLILFPNDSSMAVFFFTDLPHRCAMPDEFADSRTSSVNTGEVTAASSSLSLLANVSNISSPLSDINSFTIDFSLTCEKENSLKKCREAGGKIEYDCCYPFASTASSEFNMICENQHYRSFAQSQLGIGFLCASVIFGQLSDKFGRRRIAMILLCLRSITVLLLSICTSYYQFALLFFLCAFLGYGAYLCIFILLSESFGSSKRFLISVKMECAAVCGELLTCGLFYVGNSWRLVPLLTSATTMVSFLIMLLFIYESPLWLLSQRKFSRAEIVMQKMSSMNNRKPLTPDQMNDLKEFYGGNVNVEKVIEGEGNQDEEDSVRIRSLEKMKENGGVGDYEETLVETKSDELGKSERISHSAVDLFKHPVVRVKSLMVMLNWFIITSAFYSVYLNLTSLNGSDPFVSFASACVIAVPGIFIFGAGMQLLGRRLTFCIFMSIGATCGLGILLVHMSSNVLGFQETAKEQNEIILLLSLTARLFFGCSFGVIYVWSSELYPTPVRNIGMGMSSMCGRIGLLSVPFALESGIKAQALVSMLGFVAAMQSFFLPETLNSPLPQTLKDSQTIKLRSLKEACTRTEAKFGEEQMKKTIVAHKLSRLDEQEMALLTSDDEYEEEISLHYLNKVEGNNGTETAFVIASLSDTGDQEHTT